MRHPSGLQSARLGTNSVVRSCGPNGARAFIVCSGTDRYPKGEGIAAIGLRELAKELRSLA
jgi:hypothetical protein